MNAYDGSQSLIRSFPSKVGVIIASDFEPPACGTPTQSRGGRDAWRAVGRFQTVVGRVAHGGGHRRREREALSGDDRRRERLHPRRLRPRLQLQLQRRRRRLLAQ